MAKRKLKRTDPWIVWFAKGGDIARAGPFPDQIRAAASLMVHLSWCRSKRWPYTEECDCGLTPINGAFVWPEESPKR